MVGAAGGAGGSGGGGGGEGGGGADLVGQVDLGLVKGLVEDVRAEADVTAPQQDLPRVQEYRSSAVKRWRSR